jgi:hypothetical protein
MSAPQELRHRFYSSPETRSRRFYRDAGPDLKDCRLPVQSLTGGHNHAKR